MKVVHLGMVDIRSDDSSMHLLVRDMIQFTHGRRPVRQIATGHTLALLGQQGLVAVVVRWERYPSVRWERWRSYRSDDSSMHLLVGGHVWGTIQFTHGQ